MRPGALKSARPIKIVGTPCPALFAALVGQHRIYVRKQLRRINNLLAEGRNRAALNRERQLLRSYALRVLAAHRGRIRLAWLERCRAIAAAKHSASRHYGPSIARTLDVARRTDLWEPTDEQVGIVAMPKKSGAPRFLEMFGIEHRTRQEMLRITLANRVGLHPSQYAVASGLRQIQADIANALATGEYAVAACTDIPDFHGSINVEALGTVLRIPIRIVRANIGFARLNLDVRQMRKIRKEATTKQTNELEGELAELATLIRANGGHSYTHYVHEYYWEPRGISTGSSCAPIVAETAIAACLPDIPVGVKLFVWVDDILVLATNEADAQRAIETLRVALAAAPVGPFHLKPIAYASVSDGFDFIGSTFRTTRDGPIVAPTRDNVLRLRSEMRRHLHTSSRKGKGRANAELFLRGWVAANRLWPEADETLRHYQSELDRAEEQYIGYYRGRSGADASESTFLLRAIGRNFPAPTRKRQHRDYALGCCVPYLRLASRFHC